VRSRARRRRFGVAAVAAGLAGIAAADTLWWPGGVDRADVVPAGACVGSVAERVVPVWARTGFSDPEPVATYAIGQGGDMVAILFGRALHAPVDPAENNKVLWVPRVGGAGPLHIRAVLQGSDETADVDLPGVGPSYVDMPRAGCWRMTLTWDGHQDVVELPYVGAG
jgi:hypothetical protein